MSKSFNILSIDGGGFRGVYPAHILKRIEEEFRVEWHKKYDLLAGTSTGSIIAASLALGRKANEVLDMYIECGSDIFPTSVLPKLGLLASRYRNTKLIGILNEFFGDTKLGEIEIPLIIPATDIANGCVHVFKSSYHNEFFRDKDVRVADAILASCSAPTYFPPTLISGKKPYLLADGGLWANSPSLAAAIDAKRRLDVDLDDLRVLSLGTGKTNRFYPIKKYKKQSMMGWGIASRWKGGQFIEMLLNLQAENANNTLGLLLNREQILRINFDSDRKLPLDDPGELDDLVSRADRDFTHNAEKIRTFINEGSHESID